MMYKGFEFRHSSIRYKKSDFFEVYKNGRLFSKILFGSYEACENAINILLKIPKEKKEAVIKKEYNELIYCGCGCGETLREYNMMGTKRNKIFGHVAKNINFEPITKPSIAIMERKKKP